MERSELIQEVVQIVSSVAQIPAERMNEQSDLKAEFGVDSLTGLKIVAILEKRYGIRVPDDEIDFYTTIGGIVATIERLGPAPLRGSAS